MVILRAREGSLPKVFYGKTEKLARRGAQAPYATETPSADADQYAADRYAERRAESRHKRDRPYHEFEPVPYPASAGKRMMDYGEAVAVLRATEGVWRLHEWAKSGRAEVEGPKSELWEAEGPSVEAWLIGKKLPEIYERHFGRPFRVSKPAGRTGSAYGPGISFIQACLLPLGIPKKPDAIEKRWSRYRQQWDIAAEN